MTYPDSQTILLFANDENHNVDKARVSEKTGKRHNPPQGQMGAYLKWVSPGDFNFQGRGVREG